MQNLLFYFRLARPDNWTKNVLIIPGFLLAFFLTPDPPLHLTLKFLFGIISVCAICSANYIINEWLDREFDKFHPEKRHRLSVIYSLNENIVMLEYLSFVLIGIIFSLFISTPFLLANVLLLIMGIIYNVKPIRSKDYPYLDVLTESVNNPIRLLLGWFMVTTTLLPSCSLLIAYWMGGAFVMTIKRYAELKLIDQQEVAVLYRRSFQHYSAEKLLVSSFFYAICAAFFWGAFVVKYRIEWLTLFPLYAILFAWYLLIGLKPNSIARAPEHIYKEKTFTLYAMGVAGITFFLLFVNLK